MTSDQDYHFQDFTEAGYRSLLAEAKLHYQFERFGTQCDAAHALWRHDVDISMHRALWCARAEHEQGVVATYFLMMHSEFYNLFEASIISLVQEIAKLGHRFGIHFDPLIYSSCNSLDELEGHVGFERSIVERIIGIELEAISFHNPTNSDVLKYDQDSIAGLWNAYAASVGTKYTYMSDSNGYWRFQRVPETIAQPDRPRYLHLLTHPEWWTRHEMSPRRRVQTAINGRAARVMADYDAVLAFRGRLNVS